MNALTLVHNTIKEHLLKTGCPAPLLIDATAGRGRDTAFLCSLAGTLGKVIAFDIQEEAIRSTRELLESRGLFAELHLDSHENMGLYAPAGSADVIVFNLGWLPGGSHEIFTHFESTKKAVTEGLRLLKNDGLMCVSVYYGGASGYDEKNALLDWLAGLDSDKYQVLVTHFHNWANDPPIPVFITKVS